MMQFQKLSVKVADVSMGRLVLFFTEGFFETLIGFFKSHNPTTLKDVMSLTRDLQNVLPRTRFPPKPNFKFENMHWKRDAPDKNPFQIDSIENNNKEGLKRDELQRKKLCFACFQPWTPGHKCTKGKAQYIEIFSDNDEYQGGMDEEGHNSDQEESYEIVFEE